jgi:hypothetical protein
VTEEVQPKPKSRRAIGFVAGVIVLLGLAAFAARVYLRPKPSPFLTEGFDFNMLRKPEIDWRGPDLGTKVDLTRLESRDGRTLASVIDNRPIMIVALSPECPMCSIANDELLYLRDELANRNVNYYMSFFTAPTPDFDTFKYADGLNLGVPSFIWNKTSGPPPEPIFKMTTPSHLLVKNDGTVIRVWPGSYAEKSVRDRMAHQILSETSVVMDTLNAQSRNEPAR